MFLGTVAFQVDLDEYTTIPLDSVVIFDVVELNLGNQWVWDLLHIYYKFHLTA